MIWFDFFFLVAVGLTTAALAGVLGL